ncbi:MAG: ATP-binding cassette domain-containing protein [[Clostridium] scindens]
MEGQYRLEMKNITKRFGGVKALTDVSLKVEPGEIHALIGENGAGKSTLMKILSGAYQRDSGQIFIDGRGSQDYKSKRVQGSGRCDYLSGIHARAGLDGGGEYLYR